MTTASPTPEPSGSDAPSLLERISRAPGRRAGIAAAVVAVVLLLVPALELVLLDERTDPVPAVQIFLGLNAIALLGFLPLLHAAHAATARTGRPGWLLPVAYLVLLIRPVVLVIEIANAPTAVFAGLGFFYALLGTTGVAARSDATSASSPRHSCKPSERTRSSNSNQKIMAHPGTTELLVSEI